MEMNGGWEKKGVRGNGEKWDEVREGEAKMIESFKGGGAFPPSPSSS